MKDGFRARWEEIFAVNDSVALQIELLKRFLKDFTGDVAAWTKFGMALNQVARFREAESALRRALELGAGRWKRIVYCELGNTFRQKGDFASAAWWYRRAIAHSPDVAEGYIYLGGMLAALGRLDEAEAVHRRGTVCGRGCVEEACYNLGLVLRARERYAEAAAFFESALRIDPEYELAREAKRDVEGAMRVRRDGGRARES